MSVDRQSGDFRVLVKVQNAHLWRAILDAGYKTVAEFCRHADINRKSIDDLLAMRVSPLTPDKVEWRPVVKKLSELLGPLPEEMFPDSIPVLSVNTAEAYLPIEKVEALMDASKCASIALGMINAREAQVMVLHAQEETLDNIGARLEVSRERVRQIQQKALHKIRRGIFELEGKIPGLSEAMEECCASDPVCKI